MSDGGDNTILLNLLQQAQNIASQIGLLQGNVNILIEERGRASESRARLYEKMEDVDRRLDAFEVVKKTVDRIAPLVDAQERVRADGLAVRSFGRRIFTKGWAGVAAIAAACGWLANEYSKVLDGLAKVLRLH